MNQAGVGTLACAVLGAGTTATAATAAAPQPARNVAVTVGHELARTGVNFTVELAVLAALLLVAGLLLVSLARRHAPPTKPVASGYRRPHLA